MYALLQDAFSGCVYDGWALRHFYGCLAQRFDKGQVLMD